MLPQFSKNIYTFEQAEKRLNEFELFLKNYDITIVPGSDLERYSLNIYDVLYKHQIPEYQNKYEDIRQWIRNILGMNNLIFQILKIKDHNSIAQLTEHLKLLNEGNPLQTSPTKVTDESSNKLFELLIATAVMRNSINIDLEDPNEPKSNNPDILATINDTLWGFACKVAHSKKGKSIFDNVLKGIDQLEKSPAKKGVVIINTKNLIEHDKYWSISNINDWENGAEPLFTGYGNYKLAVNQLFKESCSIAKLITTDIPKDELNRAFNKKKCVSGFILYVATSCGVKFSGKPIPCSIGFLHFITVDQIYNDENRVISLLNDGLQYNS